MIVDILCHCILAVCNLFLFHEGNVIRLPRIAQKRLWVLNISTGLGLRKTAGTSALCIMRWPQAYGRQDVGSELEMASVGECVHTYSSVALSVWEIVELQDVGPSWKKQALKGCSLPWSSLRFLPIHNIVISQLLAPATCCQASCTIMNSLFGTVNQSKLFLP